MESSKIIKTDPDLARSFRQTSFEELAAKVDEAIFKYQDCQVSLQKTVSGCDSIIQQFRQQTGWMDEILNRPKKDRAINLCNQVIPRANHCRNRCSSRSNQLFEFKNAYARLLQYIDKVFIHWRFFRDTSILGEGLDLSALEQIQFYAQVLKTVSDISKFLGLLVFIASGGMFGGVIAAGLGIFDMILDLIGALINGPKIDQLNHDLQDNLNKINDLIGTLDKENEIDIFNKKIQILLVEGKYIASTGISEHDMWEALINAGKELDKFSGMLVTFYNFAASAKTPEEVKNIAETAADDKNPETKKKMTRMLFFNYYRKSDVPVPEIAVIGKKVGLEFSESDINQILASDAILNGDDEAEVQSKYKLSDKQLALIRKIVLP